MRQFENLDICCTGGGACAPSGHRTWSASLASPEWELSAAGTATGEGKS